MQKTQLFFDTECYPNYFLIVFKDLNGNEECFVKDENNVLPVARIKKLLETRQTIGFNSRLYDIPMITYALSGVSNSLLKEMSDRIINESVYNTLCEYQLWCPKEYDHIDIINVAIGKNGLKMYGARINTPYLQDLPYDPSSSLTKEDKAIIKKYCSNDVDITKNLYLHLKNEIDIRTAINDEYNVDVRSKSDAQIAEVLINKQLVSSKKKIASFDFKYKSPRYIGFRTATLCDLLEKFENIDFKGVTGDRLFTNKTIDEISINDVPYSCGIGGLHSKEEARTVFASDDEYIIDIDVVSYYPTIILNNKYCPDNYNAWEFLEFYQKIYDDRIIAKKENNTGKANVYKIILNGSFGKFGDQYSSLYSPKLLIHTTITGQLSLLMLIEELEEFGCNILSANTDGITVKLKKDNYNIFKNIITGWEARCNFKTEEVRYKSLHNQSVNSYIAVKEDGTLKCKGLFGSDDISRNPAIKICKEAIFSYLLDKRKVEDTIMNAKQDPSNFIMVRKCTKGGYWKGEHLGKVVRWYWSTQGEPITNPKGDKVANTDDAFPIMNMEDKIADIHYDKYIAKTYELLESIGMKV
jgi:DNA polymerase elongation subunit (family B)